MALEQKRFLDFTGLSIFWNKVKGYVDSQDEALLASAKTYAEEKASAAESAAKSHAESQAATAKSEAIASANEYTDGQVSTINQAATALTTRVTTAEGKITTVEGEITKLKADAQTEGSVKYEVAQGIAGVVANADEDFDTLKEVADWIANDTTGAAAMQNAISVLNGSETAAGSVAYAVKQEKDRATNEETKLGTRVGVLENLVGINGEEGGSGESISARMSTAESKIGTLESLVGEGNVSDRIATAKGEAKSELIGDAAEGYNTLGKLEDKIQAEESRAKGVEGGLDTRIKTLESATTAADLAAEISRAKAAELAISTAVGLSADNAYEAYNDKAYINGASSVRDEIVKLDTQAKAQNDALAEDVAALAAEISRAKGAEEGLQSAIDTINNTTIPATLEAAKAYADGLAKDYDAKGSAEAVYNAILSIEESSINGLFDQA